MRTVNGINIYWQTEDDLPRSCGSCPFYFDGSTSVPGVGSTQERGLCNLREMMKGRWTDTPQACLRFFRRILKAPDGERYVIVLRDENL